MGTVNSENDLRLILVPFMTIVIMTVLIEFPSQTISNTAPKYIHINIHIFDPI